VLDLFFKQAVSLAFLVTLSACVSAQSSHSLSDETANQAPIENPFGNFKAAAPAQSSNLTLISKRGDRSMQVELPENNESEITVPMNQKDSARGGAESAVGETAENGVDYQYMKQKPTIADREIASTFNSADDAVNDGKKREIENGLGLQQSDEPIDMDESYLAKVDVIKQLFHSERYEAALIEIDQLVKIYPTNAKLYEMRGTLLDRLGYPDLALRSWKQALEFEPHQLALKKMIEKRETQRSVASEKR
jgi:tetratricopeptide (TPR) repeat protein